MRPRAGTTPPFRKIKILNPERERGAPRRPKIRTYLPSTIIGCSYGRISPLTTPNDGNRAVTAV